MADLREVIRRAWLDLDAQVAPLRAREAALKDELRSVQQNIERLMSQVSDAEKAAQALGMDLTRVDKSEAAPASAPVSIKQAIRLVLDASREGLTSADLHQAVSELYFGGALERTSFSPQLSRMRAASEVDLQDSHWILKPDGRHALEAYGNSAKRAAVADHFQRHYEQYKLPEGVEERINRILEDEEKAKSRLSSIGSGWES